MISYRAIFKTGTKKTPKKHKLKTSEKPYKCINKNASEIKTLIKFHFNISERKTASISGTAQKSGIKI